MPEPPAKRSNVETLLDILDKKAAAIDMGRVENAPRFRPKWSTLRVQKQKGVEEGLKRYNDLCQHRENLQESYARLSTLQLAIIDDFTNATIEKVVGVHNFRANTKRFLLATGKKDQNCLTAVIMPRRFGKSTVTAFFVAAVALAVPGITIAIFSPSKRQSTFLLMMVKRALESSGVRDAGRFVTENAVTISIRGPTGDQTDVRTINSYPSRVQSTRGVTADIIIAEELAQIDLEVFEQVILPLLGVEGTALIAITTPLGQENYYTTLLQSVDQATQKPKWNLIKYSMVCDECKRKKIAENCMHMRHLMPRWKTGYRQELVKSMLPTSSYITEAQGEFAGHLYACFDEIVIDEVLTPTYPESEVTPRQPIHVYCFVDTTS
jgi:hypothetical protein